MENKHYKGGMFLNTQNRTNPRKIYTKKNATTLAKKI